MITIKTNTVLTNLKGEALKVGEEKLTIGEVIANVLAGKVSNPHRGYLLGKKFATEKEVELKAEDVVFIKEELANNGKDKTGGYLAMVIGQCIELLEGGKEKK